MQRKIEVFLVPSVVVGTSGIHKEPSNASTGPQRRGTHKLPELARRQPRSTIIMYGRE